MGQHTSEADTRAIPMGQHTSEADAQAIHAASTSTYFHSKFESCLRPYDSPNIFSQARPLNWDGDPFFVCTKAAFYMILYAITTRAAIFIGYLPTLPLVRDVVNT
jgi:hypothetical protein